MSTVFSKIIAGEIPCYKIYEDEYTFAFLDIAPLAPGHILIVPKTEVDKFYNVEEPYYTAVFQSAKKIASAMEKALDTQRVVAKIIGTDVPHFHVHLIPMPYNPVNKPMQMDSKTMAAITEKITQALE